MNPVVASGVLQLLKELVPDGDKRKELEAKLDSARIEVDRLIMQTTTIPWVDAVVKLMYAAERFIRPLGAAAMSAFGIYAHYKGGLGIDEAVLYGFDAAFPSWGASRHINKQTEIKRKRPGNLYGSK